MNPIKQLWKFLIICSLVISAVSAGTTELIFGAVAGLVAGSALSESSKPTQTAQRSSTKRRTSIPSNCSNERWTTQSIDSKQIATNFHGIIVTYDDMGELLIKSEIKNTIPNMFKPGDKIQQTVHFSNKSSRTTSATIDAKHKNLLITGMDAIFIANKLKSSSYVKIDFVNNKYCSRLKGSSKAIKNIESSASFYKSNKPDDINEARVTRAATEHIDHAMRVASNQKEFAEKVVGIRQKSDLDKADGNIYNTKIQYYIPGSEEIGEMWVDWHIDDSKGPMMRLNFIDPTHQYENKTYSINISLQPIQASCNTDLKIKSDKNTSPSCKIVKDLLRADKWGKIAKEQEMKRRYKKKVSFIQGDEESTKSLGVNFQVYEDGGMTAQIEEINHGYPKRFNFTLANALELSRYIEDTRQKAHKKWMNKTRSTEDLDALFN